MTEPAPLYALSSPLPASEAVTRLRSLGPSAKSPTHYRGSTSFEVAVDGNPFAPVLEVSVEERVIGSYVTVRVVRSSFLRDLLHVARCVFGACAVLGVGHVVATLSPPVLWQALCGIGAGFAALVALTLLAERVLTARPARRPHDARLRLAVGRLVHRA